MHEKEFNTIVSRSLNTLGGFGFKISDTGQYFNGKVSHLANPCDGIGLLNKHFVCWESKYLNSPSAFNFTNLQDHQIENLIKFYENIPNACYSLFLIGVNFGRGDIRVFYWMNDDLYHIKERKINKNNIFKKEFQTLTNFINIKKGLINFNEILI